VVVDDLVRPSFLRAGLHGLDNPVLIDAHNVLATLTHAAFVAVVTAHGGGLRGAVGILEGEQYDTRGNPEQQQPPLQLWRAEHPELLVPWQLALAKLRRPGSGEMVLQDRFKLLLGCCSLGKQV